MSQRQGSTPGPLWPALRDPASVIAPALLENGQRHQNWGLLGCESLCLVLLLDTSLVSSSRTPCGSGLLRISRAYSSPSAPGLWRGQEPRNCGGRGDPEVGVQLPSGGSETRPLHRESALLSTPQTFPRQLGILLGGGGRRVCKYISSFCSRAWHPHETRGRERPWLW